MDGDRLPASVRLNVLWYGPPPGPAVTREFINRGLTIHVREAIAGTEDLIGARGVVFFFDGDEFEALGELLKLQAASMLDHGLLICIATNGLNNDYLQGQISQFLPAASVQRIVRRTSPEPHEFAEQMARHVAGPSFVIGFDYKVRGNVEPLSDEDKILLGRALGAWGTPRLEEMSGGMSGARVFSAYTTMGNSAGTWAQPLFVKLDRREKTEREAENYRVAIPFIPFGLRPNLVGMISGAERGILIGDLADKSEPLWDVARRGHAEQAIFNLFNTTLGAWRTQGLGHAPSSGSVFNALVEAGIVKPDKLIAEYGAAASKEAGSRQELQWRKLGELVQAYRVGPLHGDLHAENVRVRGSDAILIDLASMKHGPLVADLALLEAWFAFALHQEEPGKDEYENPEWKAMIEKLYAPEAFQTPPPPSDACSVHSWCWDAVRQIRTLAIATQTCSSEYQTTIVAALIRRCCYEAKNRAEKYRGAIAYLTACRLTNGLLAAAEKKCDIA